MKKNREGKPFVEPPGRSWVSSSSKKVGGLKRLVPMPVEAARVEACTKGNIKNWFDRADEELCPAEYVLESHFVSSNAPSTQPYRSLKIDKSQIHTC